MPSGKDTPRARRLLGTERMEALSDGVFGFAATLLVVTIAIHPPGTALEQVLHAWPDYLAYVVSFLTIGAGWLAHDAMTDRLPGQIRSCCESTCCYCSSWRSCRFRPSSSLKPCTMKAASAYS